MPDDSIGESLAWRAGSEYDAIAERTRADPEVAERYQIIIASDEQNQVNARAMQSVHDEWIERRPNGRAVYDRFSALVGEIRREALVRP